MRTRQRGNGPQRARGEELDRLKKTTSSGFYCGICGTRERGKHKKALHMKRNQRCQNYYNYPATCRRFIEGLSPTGARCEGCDPKGATRKWVQPKDEPLP